METSGCARVSFRSDWVEPQGSGPLSCRRRSAGQRRLLHPIGDPALQVVLQKDPGLPHLLPPVGFRVGSSTGRWTLRISTPQLSRRTPVSARRTRSLPPSTVCSLLRRRSRWHHCRRGTGGRRSTWRRRGFIGSPLDVRATNAVTAARGTSPALTERGRPRILRWRCAVPDGPIQTARRAELAGSRPGGEWRTKVIGSIIPGAAAYAS